MNATPARAAVAWALLAAGTWSAAGAEDAFQGRAIVVPAAVQLGEPASYRARLIIPAGSDVRWLPPESRDEFTWGKPSARRGHGKKVAGGSAALDTLEIEAPLQVFRLGEVLIPGLQFQIREQGGTRVGRLPLVHLQVASMLTRADSNATLRPLRGPFGAPWWERVPWRWVVVGILALAGAIAFIRWWRKRKPKVAPEAVPVFDPAAEALASLAALRGLNLPGHGRFAEHAFHLTQIARRFLEATAHTPRPGDTTPELVRHLEGATLRSEERRVGKECRSRWSPYH